MASCTSDPQSQNSTSTTAGVTSTTSKRPTNPFYLQQRIGAGIVQLEIVSATEQGSLTVIVAEIFNRDTSPLSLGNTATLFSARSQLFGADIAPKSASATPSPIPVDASERITLSFEMPLKGEEVPVLMFNGAAINASDAAVWLTTYDSKVENGS